MDLKNINKDRQKKKRSTMDVGTMIYGKVPPQAKELEEAILGAIMLEKGAMERASELMKPECFYVEAHSRIFTAMQNLSISGKPIDQLTVAEELRRMEELEMVGGPYYITKLTNFVTSSAHMEHHCRIVYEKFLKREMIRIGGQLVQEAYEDSTDVFQLMDEHEGEYQKITLQKSGNKITDLNGELVSRFKRMVELQKRDNHITGIPSGFHSLDLITHGWQNTDLIILAARPAVGKTAFALNLARNATRYKLDDGKKINVGLFSLEMSKGQLVDRIIASESETWLDKIMTGKMEEANLQNIFRDGIQPLSSSGIYIDDTAGLNIYQLRSKARYMIRKFNVNMIIIDYLQLMSGVEDRRINNREQEISNISRNLKVLAKELNIPIIALSQLSRNVEQRKGDSKTPVLSDLRDSGAIEQDADMVMFMYRPEYYNIGSDALGESTAGLTEISIAKHRNGSLAQGQEAIKLRANLSIQKFYPWEMMDQVRTDLITKGFRPITKNDRGDDINFD